MLDCSAALAWVLPQEESAASRALLHQVAQEGAAVPALWALEIANVLLINERRRRITMVERREALAVLADLPIRADTETARRAWADTVDLAARHGLTSYDACYLELAVRLRLPLATLDAALRRAAIASGVGMALDV